MDTDPTDGDSAALVAPDASTLADLTLEELAEVALVNAGMDPALEIVASDVEDTDAPHGQNTLEEMAP